MREFLRRLRYLAQRGRFDRELADEMAFHREMAGREGTRRFGNALRLREEARDAWGMTWIDQLGQDLRYAARTLSRSPGFTLSAVLVLGLGIGVNLAAFGFFNMMVLRPLPVSDPATIVRIQRRAPGSFSSTLPYPMMAFYRAHAQTLQAVLASTGARLTFDDDEAQIDAGFVTANYFTGTGASAALGRLLEPGRDDVPGAVPVVVLSHGFWHRRLGGDRAVVGRIVRLGQKTATVIGVSAEAFSGLRMEGPDLWAPITLQPHFVRGSVLLTEFAGDGRNGESWGGRGVEMWGRMRPGVTPRAVEDELHRLATVLREQRPHDVWDHEAPVTAAGAHPAALRPQEYPLVGLAGALALLILAVACSNLGSLLLARGVARDREIALRVAVGAGQGRLVRQLFTESLVLALLGAVAGLLLGHVVLRSLMAFTDAPAWVDPTPDWHVVLFALAMGLLAALLFGLTPALQIARQRHRASLLRQCLIGAQVAASCVLLIVAGLLVRALNHATHADLGFAHERVILIEPRLASHGYTPAQARVYLDTLEQRLRGLPGVERVALAGTPPLGRMTTRVGLDVDGRPMSMHVNRIGPEFFETMGVALQGGRALARGDTHAMVVSDSLARLLWPAQNPLGQQLTLDADTFTVVGVSGNARLVGLEDSDASTAYFPAGADDLPSMVMLVKTSTAAEGIVSSARATAKALDSQVFPHVQLLSASFDRKIAEAERSAAAVGLLGMSALLLACLGIVGMVAYAVSQRTQEIGIRMALGARTAHVLSAVLRQFLTPVGLGLIAGVGGAAALSQVMRRVLYGVSHLDPIAYTAAIAVFVVTVVLAALWPARRALRVDPMRALRQA